MRKLAKNMQKICGRFSVAEGLKFYRLNFSLKLWGKKEQEPKKSIERDNDARIMIVVRVVLHQFVICLDQVIFCLDQVVSRLDQIVTCVDQIAICLHQIGASSKKMSLRIFLKNDE